MNNHTIISALSLSGSLTAYYYAKFHEKDRIPAMLIGGFFGAIIGELIAQKMESTKNRIG